LRSRLYFPRPPLPRTEHRFRHAKSCARAIVANDADEATALVSSLATSTDPVIPELLTAWREGAIFIYEFPETDAAAGVAPKIPITFAAKDDETQPASAFRVDSGKPLVDARGASVLLRSVGTRGRGNFQRIADGHENDHRHCGPGVR
jgi:hypothetical protein